MRLTTAIALALGLSAIGCGQPVAIFEAPDFGPAKQRTLTPCNDTNPCPAGEICIGDLCKPDDGNPDTPDTVTPDPGETADVQDPPTDAGPPNTPDDGPVAQDTNPGTTDPGSDPPDTKPPTPVDSCTWPGQTGAEAGCEDPLTGCRVEPDGSTVCSGSTSFSSFGLPCSAHVNCDILWGCHFGICTSYCELQFGGAGCLFPGYTCTTVGHPSWGACKQAPGP